MKNILVEGFCSLWVTFNETRLEIIENKIKEGNNVYYLRCNDIAKGACDSNCYGSYSICMKCKELEKKGFDLIKFDKKNIIDLEYFPTPNFKELESLDELAHYEYDGINLGFGAANALTRHTRDYDVDIKKHNNYIKRLLRTAYLSYKNIDKIVKEKNIDEIYIFNGRFAESHAIVQYCKKNNIDYYLHERGSNPEKYELFKNGSFHSLNALKSSMMCYWNKNDKDRNKIAQEWYESKRDGKDWYSYTKKQKRNTIPKDFNYAIENIAVFNSSLDEFILFDDWQNHICKNENVLFFKLIEYFKDDRTKHFYLRIHPNLSKVDTTQVIELKEFGKKEYPNLTIIWPNENIDSYALIENCDKVLTFTSTIGAEACFMGKPVILAGRSLYEDLDVAYRATDFEHLVELLNSNLEPKPKENCYPLGYWTAIFGIKYNHVKSKIRYTGTFKGVNIRNIFWHNLKKIIQFYKIINM